MTPDISSRADIDALMLSFYQRAMQDPLIGRIFTDVARLDLAHHLPVIGDFWESTLFGTGRYSRHDRNPLLIHEELDRRSALEATHFDRWLELFVATVDESFSGRRAEYAKQRGHAIAARMQQFLGERRAGARAIQA
ncbi:MAG TPA: group III truncated hemoglobin [Thermoanaerobaculia bacterium]|nr:group III truncated hemoglobin [Thermoanaerobaculia bacterium]